jgi:lipoate-protein ligase A
MQLLEVTLPEPPANLALDEAILDQAEDGLKQPGQDPSQKAPAFEFLRLWSPANYFVVVGRSCRVAEEVHLDFCQQNQIPVLRRSSGGGTILAGPGCLLYSLVISYQRDPRLRMINHAHEMVISQMQQALRTIGIAADYRGQSDLTLGNLKFSGNAMRCKRHHFLYHGTLLLDFDLELMPRALKSPPRQPDYRAGRSHKEFVTNLHADAIQLRQAIVDQWNAQPTSTWPSARTQELVQEKYGREEWNFRH